MEKAEMLSWQLSRIKEFAFSEKNNRQLEEAKWAMLESGIRLIVDYIISESKG